MHRGRQLASLSEDEHIDFCTQSPANIHFDFNFDTSAEIAPTHALHVRSVTGGPLGAIYPIHPLILLSSCGAVPTFRPAPYVDATVREDVPLPRVGFPLPHPKSFSVLLDYLYTRNKRDFWLSLCPVPLDRLAYIQGAEGSADGTQRVIEVLLALYDGDDIGLANAVERVKGVRDNAYHLSVDDEDLWITLRSVWFAYSGVVNARGDQPLAGPSTQHRPDHAGCIVN